MIIITTMGRFYNMCMYSVFVCLFMCLCVCAYVFVWLQEFFRDSVRIEAAFRKHFHRADPHQKEDSYEIMVCHANVIRYFVCR